MSTPADDLTSLEGAFALAGAAIFQGAFLEMLRSWPDADGRDWITRHVAPDVVEKRVALRVRFEELYDTGLPLSRVFSALVDEGHLADFLTDSPLAKFKAEKHHDA